MAHDSHNRPIQTRNDILVSGAIPLWFWFWNQDKSTVILSWLLGFNKRGLASNGNKESRAVSGHLTLPGLPYCFYRKGVKVSSACPRLLTSPGIPIHFPQDLNFHMF